MIKKISVLLAFLLCMASFCFAGCGNSAQAPEAIAVSIYKVEKEQDEDGNVYITNYNLWKSYSVTPTEMIDLPDYDPEKEDKDSKISYNNDYSSSRDHISGNINGRTFTCKNKVQFMPSGNSYIFARERKKKTINFFYEGKNITEYLNEEQLKQYNEIFKDTYAESFGSSALYDFMKNKFGSSWQTKSISLYTRENGENYFCEFGYYYVVYDGYGHGGFSDGGFTLIKSTDVYIKVAE